MLRANLLNDIANLSIEKDDSDDFSSDYEDNSEDDFCEWDIKSGLYVFTDVIKFWDGGGFVVHTETFVLFLQRNPSLFLETFSKWCTTPPFSTTPPFPPKFSNHILEELCSLRNTGQYNSNIHIIYKKPRISRRIPVLDSVSSSNFSMMEYFKTLICLLTL